MSALVYGQLQSAASLPVASSSLSLLASVSPVPFPRHANAGEGVGLVAAEGGLVAILLKVLEVVLLAAAALVRIRPERLKLVLRVFVGIVVRVVVLR
jgi:hypothetical protein